MQRKMSNEKIARRKISFSTHKTRFFSFFLVFGPLLLSKLLTFSIFYSIKKNSRAIGGPPSVLQIIFQL
jgi:hypothetical protein